MRACLLILPLLFLSCSLFYPGQDGSADISFVPTSTQSARISISGQIVDNESGEPLIGADIEIVGLKETSTDLDGCYSFADIPAGTYTLKFHYIGHKPYQISKITLDGRSIAVINVKLVVVIVEGGPLINVPVRTK